MNIETVCEKYQLTADEKRILKYIYSHRSSLKKLSIRQLAKQTFSSPSFIIKTCKKMNLSGYSELVFLITDTPVFPSNLDNDYIIRLKVI